MRFYIREKDMGTTKRTRKGRERGTTAGKGGDDGGKELSYEAFRWLSIYQRHVMRIMFVDLMSEDLQAGQPITESGRMRL